MVIKSVKKKVAANKNVKKKVVKAMSKKENSVDEVSSSSYIVIDYPNEAEMINGSLCIAYRGV